MNKAQAYAQWRQTTIKYRGKYWTLEEGRWVRGVSFASFWRSVQTYNRLAASDPGGNLDITRR